MTNKRTVKIMGIAILAIIVTVVTIFLATGEKFDESMEGQVKTIEYEYVNARKEPDTREGNIIGTLNHGAKVILTGYQYEYLGGEGFPEEHWTQVIYDGEKVAWVVSESIAW